MITEKNPESWQQLQEWTAQILRECGWTAEIEVKLTTVRGTAEIDVLAIETVQGREYKTLIECKNWTARVPQNVVHGFRTVMADVGANTGYIISKAGFQAGAYEAAANTNVRLLSWTEFQEVFVDQWYWTYLTKQTYEVLDPLCSYLDPVPAMAFWDSYLNQDEIARLKEMYHQHFPLGALIFALLPFMAMLPGREERIRLPLGDRAHDYGDLPKSLTSRTGYREFFEELVKHALPIRWSFSPSAIWLSNGRKPRKRSWALQRPKPIQRTLTPAIRASRAANDIVQHAGPPLDRLVQFWAPCNLTS